VVVVTVMVVRAVRGEGGKEEEKERLIDAFVRIVLKRHRANVKELTAHILQSAVCSARAEGI
jgi:hypothetical protein